MLAGALALTQDSTVGAASDMARMVALFSSSGVMLAITAAALRRVYRQSPWRATAAAAIVGGVCCFLVVAVRSESMLTLFLPALALLVGALTMRSVRPWPISSFGWA